MTIDTLTIAIQKDFNEIHVEIAGMKGVMATKVELRATEEKILRAIAGLRTIIESIDARFSAYAVRTNEDISKLQASVKDIDVRLRVVEKRG